MAGHSKWKNIQHRKSAQDAKRGKVFTKLIKEITVAAKMGGGDPDANPRLRSAITNAKGQGMPKDNIERAIKKGTGEGGGADYESITYEGYGPNNVAVIVETLTDNRNRTISSVRHAFTKCNGNLGSTNSVQYMFDHVGSLRIEREGLDEDTLTEMALESGASDVVTENPEEYQVLTEMTDFETVRSFFEGTEVKVIEAGLIWNPQNRVEIDDVKKAEQVLKLIDLLEDDDDVQYVYSNFDLSEAVLNELG
jgi:YebC/PmpR family DNA-binding regulatory protein